MVAPRVLPLPLLPAASFEKVYYNALHKNIALSVQHLDLSFPCTVELGVLGLAGVHLAINEEDIRGPIAPNETIVRQEISVNEPAAVNALLLDFFTEVYDKTGYPPVLRELHGFPPGPPQA